MKVYGRWHEMFCMINMDRYLVVMTLMGGLKRVTKDCCIVVWREGICLYSLKQVIFRCFLGLTEILGHLNFLITQRHSQGFFRPPSPVCPLLTMEYPFLGFLLSISTMRSFRCSRNCPYKSFLATRVVGSNPLSGSTMICTGP